MDFVVELVIEVLGELLEFALGNIKNPSTRKWALTIFYTILLLGITALPGCFAFSFLKEGNVTGSVVLGVISGALLFGGGFLVIRGHRQNWKGH